MKIKKIIVIVISLIMILNMLVPTVALAVNEVNEKETSVEEKNETENVSPNNNTENNTTNTDNKDENSVSENESSENIVQDETNETDENEENNTVIDENKNEQEQAQNTEIKNNEILVEKQINNTLAEEPIKGRLYLDEPTNGNMYYSSETPSIKVRGWKMANISNSYIKGYVNNEEISSDIITYVERPDVLKGITDCGTAEQNPTPGFEFYIDTASLKEGENTITIKLYSKDNKVLTTLSVTINFSRSLHVQYRSHVEEEGWQGYVQDGAMSGTSGKSYRLEAINIELLNNTEKNVNIKYQVHVEELGWQDWKENGEMAGTQKQSLRLEAIKIELENSEDYSIMYRVHIQDKGWQDWKTDGEMAGTTGESLRLEAIEIKIIEKQTKGRLYLDEPTNGNMYYSSETPSIKVRGWKMANISNSYIKGYVNNEEISSDIITYVERPDVLKGITDCGTAEQNPTPGFEFYIDTASLKEGENTITIKLYSKDNKVLTTLSVTINFSRSLHVQYRSHVEEEGWQGYVQDGAMSGTSGKSYRLEAINIELLNNTEKNVNIKYQVHVEELGWQDWKENGEMAGTQKQSLRLEAIKIELENSEDYSIMYRVHIQDKGWQDWKTDGEMAGTTGESLRLEAIEIKIVEKQKKSRMYIDTPTNGTTYYGLETSSVNVSGWKMANVSNTSIKAYVDGTPIDSTLIKYTERPDVIKAITDYGTAEQNPTPGFNFDIDISKMAGGSHTIKIEIIYKDKVLESNSLTFYIDTEPHIKYSAHVEEIGWQDFMQDGATAGTIGEALRVEALKIELINAPATAHVKYRVYVQGTGWTNYAQDGEQAGTTGQSKKIQAIQIELEGLDGYLVEYQAHVQNIGWQPWAVSGMEAGTTTRNYRIEALNVRIVKEGNSIVPQVKYSVHDEKNGWSIYGENGVELGSTTNGLKLDAIKVALKNSGIANIKYRVHVQEIGWMSDVQNDTQAGTGDSTNGIEAVEMNLEGLDDYSIEYRTYVIGQGWQAWVRDGQTSGTTGQSLQISAIQIRIVIKDDGRKFSNFSDLDESKYPGYKEKLQALQNQHPNWIITIDYTGLDWNTVLDNEDQVINGVPRSLTQYGNQWKNGDAQYGTGWYRASRAAIAYMMDPRNSLDDGYVFQFQDLTSSAGTYQDIAKMIEGTFLTKYTTSSTDSIINTILESSNEYNISPYHLVSRMLQEQGNGGSTLNGYLYSNGISERIVYNLFNIGATGNSDAEIIQNGAAYAYNNHWFTPETCINGSAKFLYDGYLSQGQTTLYYQKYDVVQAPYYTHQYMQNIRAANDEGKRVSDEYKANGMINSEFEFLIPVYENMPATASPSPAR